MTAFKNFRSWIGLTLVAIYLIGSAIIIYQVYGCKESAFLGCDFSLVLLILPAAPLLVVLEKLGLHIADPHFRYPGPHASDVGLLALYMLVSAVFIYLAGLALGWIYGLLRKAVRHIATPR